MRRVPDKGLGYGILKYLEKAAGLQGPDPWDIIFNYLGQLDTTVESGKWLSMAAAKKESNVAEKQCCRRINQAVPLNGHVVDGELVLRWNYSSRYYNVKTISKIAGDYINQLQILIAHCQEQGQSESVYTPFDYGLSAEITYRELDHFFEESYNGKPIKGQIESLYRLSGLQQGMLFHGLYDNAGSYIEQFGCDLIGVNLDLLLASWSVVIKRHSTLRSAFYYDSFNIPVQCVFKEVTLPVQELDYRRMNKVAQAVALKAYEAADRAGGFNFKTAPLMRLCMIRLEKTVTGCCGHRITCYLTAGRRRY